MADPRSSLTNRYYAAFTRAQRQPIRVYRVMHTVLHYQMGIAVTLADAAATKWRNDQAGIPVTIVEDWLDLRPESFLPEPPPKPKKRRQRKLRVVR